MVSEKRRFFVERSIYVQKCWNLVLRYIAERRARNENPRIFWFLPSRIADVCMQYWTKLQDWICHRSYSTRSLRSRRPWIRTLIFFSYSTVLVYTVPVRTENGMLSIVGRTSVSQSLGYPCGIQKGWTCSTVCTVPGTGSREAEMYNIFSGYPIEYFRDLTGATHLSFSHVRPESFSLIIREI